MMQISLIFLLIAGVVNGFVISPFNEDEAFSLELRAALEKVGVTPRIMEQNIVTMLENTIAQIPTYTEHQVVNISIANETLTAKGTLDKVTITGLEAHTIDNVKFTILPVALTLHVQFDDVQVRGLYDIDGLFGKIIPVYGNGDLDVGASGFSFSLKLNLVSKSGHLAVKDLSVDISVEAVRFRLGNFLDGDLGVVISELIEENASDYLARIMYYYGQTLQDGITSVVNKYLEDKTIDDILGILQGKTTLPPSTTSLPF